MEAHGGRIWAESGGPGPGARFTFTLQAVEAADTLLPAGSAARGRRRGRQRVRVLVVDDDPQTLRYVRDALSNTGYDVSAAGDPEEALRRRAAPERVEPPEPYVLGDLRIDYANRRVSVAGQEVRLTATQYDLLAELAVNAGRVVTHGDLLHRVWGPTRPGSVQVIRTQLMRLRRKLGEDSEDPKYIFAEPRVGYRMAVGETAGPDMG